MERLVLAMELSEFGLTPAMIVTVVTRHWHRLGPIFRAAQKQAMLDPDDGDIILTLGAPRFTTGPWLEQDEKMLAINKTTVDDLCAHIQAWMTHSTPPPRIIAVNLSARLRDFHAALIVASDGGQKVLIDDEEPPAPEARALAALRQKIDPLRKKFATAEGLTPEEAGQLGRLLQREAKLRDQANSPQRSGSRRRKSERV
jgi:hypothetical protein